jgi:hypothetical protein
MRRRTFDVLVTWAGAGITVMLLVAGTLLWVGYSFANNNVHEQLSAQKIFFPEKGSPALEGKEIKPYLEKYAGQQMTNGAQAEAYANHFIKVHLKESTGGKTYAELSTASRANATDTKLAQQVQTAFRGETLRGLLLNAYAFWKVGQLAMLGSIVAFALAALMFVLTLLGFRHATMVSAKEEILRPASARAA